MFLGYAGVAVICSFLQINTFAFLLKALVLVPPSQAILEGRVLFATGGYHEDAARLAALLEIGHFLIAQLITGLIPHYFRYQHLSFHLAQLCVIWITCNTGK